MVLDELSELVAADPCSWREPLEAHCDTRCTSLVFAEKGTSEPTLLTIDLALGAAPCHGWIDGQAPPRWGTYPQIRGSHPQGATGRRKP